MVSNNGSTIGLSYSGNLGSQMGIFSGVCYFGLTDYGTGDYGLNGPCGSGVANSAGYVTINIAASDYTGTFNGTWGAWGASGTLTATLNAGGQLYQLTRSGSTIGIIIMQPNGTFNGFNQGSTVSGYINAEGRGAITLGSGNYFAATTANTSFGTMDYGGSQNAIAGSFASFFAVDSGGNIFTTGAVFSVTPNDPAWLIYCNNNGLNCTGGFNSVLSVSMSNVFYPGGQTANGYNFVLSGGIRLKTP